MAYNKLTAIAAAGACPKRVQRTTAWGSRLVALSAAVGPSAQLAAFFRCRGGRCEGPAMSAARRAQAALSPITIATAATMLWSCAPTSESQTQPSAAEGDRARAATVGGQAALAPASAGEPTLADPGPGVADSRSGEQIALCGEGETVIELEGIVRGDRLILRPYCTDDPVGRPLRILPVQLDAPATAAGEAGRPILNLWQTPLASRQRRDMATGGQFLDFRLVTGSSNCPAIRATALADPPAPARLLDRSQRWDRAFGFHADADCSILIVWIGNEAVVLETGRPRRANLFQLQLDFIGGPNG